MRTDQELAAYIGLDWGDQRHAVQMQPATGGPVEPLTLEQRPHVLHGWVAQLSKRFGGRPVGIAIEQRRGAVIHALMQYECLVLYPVNPKALARYREAFHPSGGQGRTRLTRPYCSTCCAHIKTSSGPGDQRRSRSANSNCSPNTAASSSNLRGGLTNRITSLLKQYSRRPSTGSARLTHAKPATFCGSGPRWPPSSGPAPPRSGGSISNTTAAGPR